MIDSTGHHFIQRVECVFYPQTLDLKVYTPQFGHDGGPLSVGSYFDHGQFDSDIIKEQFECFLKGSLLTLERSQERWSPKMYELRIHPSPYAYGTHLEVPDLGFGLGKVMWVCPSCLDQTSKIPGKIYDKLSLKHMQWWSFIDKEKKILQKEKRQNSRALRKVA